MLACIYYYFSCVVNIDFRKNLAAELIETNYFKFVLMTLDSLILIKLSLKIRDARYYLQIKA